MIVGRFGVPHGVQGWIRVQSFTEVSEDILRYGPWRLSDSPPPHSEVQVRDSRKDGKGLLVRLRECESREELARFTGQLISVPASCLPDPGHEEFYWHQLIGMRVVNRQQQDFGTVTRLIETGAHDVLVVQGDDASIDRSERLIPWRPQVVVCKVDIERALITVDWGDDY